MADDFFSDYVAPGMALVGIGWTGARVARELNVSTLRAPWRASEESRQFFGGYSADMSRQATERFGAISSGAALREQLDEIQRLLAIDPTGSVMSHEQISAAWQAARARTGFAGTADVMELLPERMSLAFSELTDRTRLLHLADTPIAEPFLPTIGGVESALGGRPEVAEEFARQLGTARGAELAGVGEAGWSPKHGVYRGAPGTKPVGYQTVQALSWANPGSPGAAMEAIAAAGMDRKQLGLAMGELAGALGPETTVTVGSRQGVGNVMIPTSLKFQSNRALIELPIVSLVSGIGTVSVGPHGGIRQIAPRFVRGVGTGSLQETGRNVRDIMGEGGNVRRVGLPSMELMDIAMMRELTSALRMEEIPYDKRFVIPSGDRAAASRNIEQFLNRHFYSIYRATEYMKPGEKWAQKATAAGGLRGLYEASGVQVLGWEGMSTEQTREAVEALAEAGYDVTRSPQALAKGRITLPKGGALFEEFSILGATTSARPDQLYREMRATPQSIEQLRQAGLDITPRALSKARHKWGTILNDPALNLRAAIGSEEAWGVVARELGVDPVLGRLAPEEMLGAPGLRELKGQLPWATTLEANAGNFVNPQLKEISDMMMNDRAFAEALAHGKTDDYISGLSRRGFHGRAGQLDQLLTFAPGTALGYQPGSGLTSAGELGGVFRLESLTKQVVGEGADSRTILRLGGVQQWHVAPGFKFMGSRTTKGTMKGFMGSAGEFTEAAARFVAVSELAQTLGTGEEAARAAYGQLFTGSGAWRDTARRAHYMSLAHGTSILTTEGAKGVGGAGAREFSHMLANEVVARMRAGGVAGYEQAATFMQEAGFSGLRGISQPAIARQSRYEFSRERGVRPIASISRSEPALRSGTMGLLDVRNNIVRAAEALGIIDRTRFDDWEALFRIGTESRPLTAAQTTGSKAAWEQMSNIYGGTGFWNVEMAMQGDPRYLGAGTTGSANIRVIEALRAQGAGVLAEDIMMGMENVAQNTADLYKMAGVLSGDVPAHVIPLDKVTNMDALFAADPGTRRAAWEALGVSPGADVGIDLGGEVKIPDTDFSTRYVRPGQTMTGHVGVYRTGEAEVLKTVDARLRALLMGVKAQGGIPDVASAAGRALGGLAENYFNAIAGAVPKDPFKGRVAGSVQLQYQSGLAGLEGLHGQIIRENVAAKHFGLSPEELKAWKTGSTAGRVRGGAIYGTIWRQPIEGMYRVATTKFLNADQLLRDRILSGEISGNLHSILANMSDKQVFADEIFAAALGGDFDADQVYLKAIDPKNVKAQQTAMAMVETHSEYRMAAELAAEGGVPIEQVFDQPLHRKRLGAMGLDKLGAAEIDKAMGMGIAQYEYQKLQEKFGILLKATEETPFLRAAAFDVAGVKGQFAERVMGKYTAAELEKQVVGHISNAAETAFRATLRATSDPKRISDTSMLLGNLVERIIKSKFLPEAERATATKTAFRGIDILRAGDARDVGEFNEILGKLFAPRDKEGRELLEKMQRTSRGILEAVGYYKGEGDEYKLSKRIAQLKRSGNIEDLVEARRLSESIDNMHPWAQFWKAKLDDSAGKSATRTMFGRATRGMSNLRVNANQIFDLIGKHKGPALAGIGAAIATTMLLGSPGSIDQKTDNIIDSHVAHGRTGTPVSAPSFPATARVQHGTRTEVSAVAQKRLNSYNMGQNLSGAIGPGSNFSYRVNDHRSHVDAEYILRKMGL